MAAIPPPSPRTATVQAIYAAYEKRRESEPARGYLGASNIGHACDRYLWLSFRWAGAEVFDGRMLRLFEHGHHAEPRFVAELRMIGAKVAEVAPDGQQWAVEACGGHFRGHMDGQAEGLPEAPKTRHVLEFKTHNAKSFKVLQDKGVREAKPMHWAQMQVYMLLAGLTRAMYLAENKDTAELYEERVHLDKPEAERLIERAHRIINAAEPPLRLSEDPAWWECKFCPFHAQCHGTEAPQVNCRTCAHSTPRIEGGGWHCARHDGEIPLDFQRTGCGDHVFIPPLLARLGEPVDASPDNGVVYRTPDGRGFINGPAGFSSAEIRACEDKRALTAIPEMQQWREQFGATIVR
jgi:CRISPR/Cas system-associated exonuclease Cas4 (RecB family)